MRFHPVLLLSLALCLPGRAEELPLRQAVDRALAASHELAAEQAGLDRLAAERKSAFSLYLPRVNLSTTYSRLNDPIELDLDPLRSLLIALQTDARLADLDLNTLIARGTPLTAQEKALYGKSIGNALSRSIPSLNMHVLDADLFRSELEVIQPVWVGGKQQAANRAARLNRQVGDESMRLSRDQVMESTVRLYLLCQMTEEAVRVGREVEEGISRHEAQARSLAAAGLIARYQLLRAQVALADAKKNRLTAEENRAAARSMLALALKSGKADDLALTTPLRRPEFTFTLDEVVAKVKERNSLLKTIAIQRDLAATKRRADRADYLPQLFLFGRFHLLTKDLSVLDPHWTVGAQLRLNLFSGGEKLFKMKADSALVREVEEKGREASDKLEKACDGLYHQAQVQRHLLDSFPVRLADAEENARLAESRFSSGLGISLEVVDANLLLEKVKMERLSALYNYNMVLLQLKLLQQDVDSWIGILEEAS